MSLVINLFGGPGTGKSTIAAMVYSQLKLRGVNCEMALEYAKDKVWEESHKTLENQIYVFGHQVHRVHRLVGKVDVIVTDSPLLFSLVYGENESQEFKKLVVEVFNRFANANYFLWREKPYQPEGRLQDEQGARDLDDQILRMLNKHNISYENVRAVADTANHISDRAMNTLRAWHGVTS